MTDGEELNLVDLHAPYDDALTAIGQCQFHRAYELLETLIERKMNDEKFFDVMKGVRFWMKRWDNFLKVEVGTARAQFLVDHWTKFEGFVDKYQLQISEALGLFKNGIWEEMIANYTISLEKSQYSNVEELITIAECLREVQKYGQAIETLEYAEKLSPRESLLKFLLADTFLFLGEDARGLRLIHHYFFVYDHVPFETMRAARVWELILSMRAEGLENEDIRLWLPVYAVRAGWFAHDVLAEAASPVLGADTPSGERHLQQVLLQLRERVEMSPQQDDARLAYSYIYALDTLSLAFTRSEKDTQTDGENPRHIDKKDNDHEKWQIEAKSLQKEFSQLYGQLYEELGERYGSFA